MKRLLMAVLSALLTLCAVQRAAAQYYNTGQTPASQRWFTLGSDSLRMVYPAGFEDGARRALCYMETARGGISHGFAHGPLPTPVVFKTETFLSNGLAMWAPRRIEMVGIPAANTYAMPWLKQLAVHEYRHMVQFGNVDRSTVRVLGWLFGQQAPLAASGLLPFWFLEGDAVMAETRFSTYGRALQPSFTMHYRAVADCLLAKSNPDKWFCGSMRDNVPSHYELGYQLVNYADRHLTPYIGESMTEFTARYPILLFTSQLALHRRHGTSTRQLFRDTFTELIGIWNGATGEENSATTVCGHVKSYTVYSHPLFVDDSTLLVLREDFDRPSRFVSLDIRSGGESAVAYTGAVSSRPRELDGRILWTEYRQSLFWDQKIGSYMCEMLPGGGCRTLRSAGDNVLYPVPLPEGGTAFVRYDYDGTYSVELSGADGAAVCREQFPRGTSLHGLARDDRTGYLYCIVLSDDGMWIEGIDMSSPQLRRFAVTSPSFVTIGDLSAADGMLYFNSIYSGLDEVHTIDLDTGREYRMSQSRYGTFSPSPSPDGAYAAVTTYTRDGYMAALQEIEYREEIPWSAVPHNKVNAPFREWDVPSIDDTVYDARAKAASVSRYHSRRYRRGPHVVDVHSWAPIGYDPEMLMQGDVQDTHFGATVISQNLLGSATASMSYNYLLDGHSLVKARFSYEGWAPKIDIAAQWSDRHSSTLRVTDGTTLPGGDSWRVTARVRLPMLLSSGRHIRWLTTSVQYSFDNSRVEDTGGTIYRLSTGVASIQYSDQLRRARLDLQPRWGYMLRASAAGDPFNPLMSVSWSVFGRAWLPGAWLHHGISLAAGYQASDARPLATGVIDFLPRGHGQIFTDSYLCAAAYYILPIAYPDWGLSGVFFLQRISLEAGYEFARLKQPDGRFGCVDTFGGTIMLDITPFRMPAEATITVSLGVYKPRGGKAFFSCGFSVPL